MTLEYTRMLRKVLAFWTARLDEDEQAVRAAIQRNVWAPQTGRWGITGDWDTTDPASTVVFAIGSDDSRVQVCDTGTSWLQDAARQHIARHDPARALREIKADRQIIERYEENPVPEWPLFPVLYRIEVWDGHPDYDESWRP